MPREGDDYSRPRDDDVEGAQRSVTWTLSGHRFAQRHGAVF